MREICVAGRGSRLAMAQNELVKALLEKKGYKVRIMTVSTRGDRDRKSAVTELGGNGPFVRDVEKVLLTKEADIAVHCAKDLPYELAPGLCIAGIPDAADPRDCLIMRRGAAGSSGAVGDRDRKASDGTAVGDRDRKASDGTAAGDRDRKASDGTAAGDRGLDASDGTAAIQPPRPLVIGTGSPRRIRQLQKLYAGEKAELEFREIRGNITTRLDKLRRGEYHGIVLAKAGLDRIGADLRDLDVRVFEPEEMIPAVGQGLLACECREEDMEIRALLESLTPPQNALRYQVERELFCRYRCDCRSAVGIYARISTAGTELFVMCEE